MPTTIETKSRSGKLTEILKGCRFTFTKDRMGRVYAVDKPGGMTQDVHRIVMKNITEVPLYEGSVVQSASRGNTLVVGDTICGQPVLVNINVDDITIL